MLYIEDTENDYSEIEHSPGSGSTILPFVIEIDKENSNLYPGANENQRFCYSVTGVGADRSKFANLGYLVLGICDQIVQDEIVNISVTIDGVEQDVGFDTGGRVQLTTHKNSNLISEYPGLKFNTRLNKTRGEMRLSFELTRSYPIGRNKVYLVGSNGAVNEVSTYGPVSQEIQAGYVDAYQDASVYIPVEVIPHADSGGVKASCYGEPTGTFHEDRGCGKCCITIIQPIRVEIPLEFGAEALIGSLHVKCGEVTETENKPALEKTGEGGNAETEQKPAQLTPDAPSHWYRTFY